MSIICVPAYITDSTVSSGNNAKTGLTPSVLAGYAMTSDAAAVVSGEYPTVKEGGNGLYYFLYDPEASGEAAFQIDAGDSLSMPADRFFSVVFTRDSSRIAGGINGSGTVSLAASPLDNLFVAASVSSVSSAHAFVVEFSGAATAVAGLAGLFCCVTSAARAPEKQPIAAANLVDSTHVALSFSPGFGTAPSAGDSVVIG